MRLPRLLRTASFRLAGFYAAAFGLSVTILGVVVYISATSALEAQLRSRVEAESAMLQDAYTTGGASALKQSVDMRQGRRRYVGLEYALYARSGKPVFGTIPGPMPKAGWSTVVGPPDGDEEPGEEEQLTTLTSRLPDGYVLAVADDLNGADELGEVILDTFGVALLLSVTLAIAGGILLSMVFLRRVDSITRSAEAIIEGNIGHRIAVRGTGDDLDHLALTLNRMLDRIGALMEAMRQVTNDVAHDLRTPVGRLRQSLEEARRTSLSATELKVALERAIGETDAILATFSALLRIAQIESGSRRAGFCAVNLSVLVESVCQTFAPSAEDSGRKLRSVVQPGIKIQGDRELLVQMLVNLIENAIVHTPATAVIDVALVVLSGTPLLTVCDNGPGVPTSERERIFRRFYRLDPSRNTSGNGLGLSLVGAIAELHGIRIALSDNKPGLRVDMHFPPGACA